MTAGIVLSPAVLATAAIAAGVAAGYVASQYYEDIFDQLSETYSSDEMSQAMDDISDAVEDMFNNLGDEISDKFIQGALGLGDSINKIGSLLNQIFTTSRAFRRGRDPLALDLDGDGIETNGADGTVLFDHDGDGVKTVQGGFVPMMVCWCWIEMVMA